jgi:hypothetical protein
MGRFRFLLLLSVVGGSAWAQTAIPTLAEYPPTGDGYSALQSGGAFATGAASLYYNPALLAEVERTTGSTYHATGFRQALWFGGSRDFSGFSANIPDTQGFDAGFGFFRNHLDYGEGFAGGSGNRSHPEEAAYGLGAAMRLGLPISVGGAAKFYNSYFNSDASATGWAFDLGILAAPHLLPLASQGLASLEVLPSAGVTLQNMGPDAFYVERDIADPLPFLSRTSLGARALFADAVDLSIGWDVEMALNRNSGGELTDVEGYSLSVMGLRYGRAWRHAPSEYRQIHEAWAYEFNFLQTRRVMKRIRKRDFNSPSEGIATKNGTWNPGFTIGWRKFESEWDREQSWYFSVSL